MMSATRVDKSKWVSQVALVIVLVVSGKIVSGLEQDAEILEPLASLARSIVDTITLGEALAINFGPRDVVKSFAALTWRYGWPVTMPAGFLDKVQDFYNKISAQVDKADVSDVTRKTFVGLREDLHDIIDAIMDEVRRSPDGVYTDYTQTKVKGVPLEEACLAIGIQLKAYGVDIKNYRNIASAVLGVPLMPTMASGVITAASLAPSLSSMTNMTNLVAPVNMGVATVNQLPNAASKAVSMMSNTASNSIDNLRQLNIPFIQSRLTSVLGQPVLASPTSVVPTIEPVAVTT